MTESVARTLSGPGVPGRPWLLTSDVAARLQNAMLGTLDELGAELLPAARSVRHGGKRLRPAITLAIATARATDGAVAIQAAAAVELLHHATLVHDDLLDGAARRHGAASINASNGTAGALLTGDLLIAAAHVAGSRSDPTAVLTLARTLADLCRGEALQAGQQYDADLAESDVLEVARLKAGSLLRAAAVLGGQVAGHDESIMAALARFGSEFGVALQLVDDLLDVLADAESAGKPVGADFAGGTVTLPAIVAMQQHPELRALLRRDPDETSRHRALRLLRCPVAVRATRHAAREHADRATRSLLDVAASAPGLHALATWPALYVEHQLRSLPSTSRERCCS